MVCNTGPPEESQDEMEDETQEIITIGDIYSLKKNMEIIQNQNRGLNEQLKGKEKTYHLVWQGIKYRITQNSNGKFQCPKCPDEFTRGKNMYNHMAVHSGYWCEICKKHFTCKEAYLVHKKKRHEGENKVLMGSNQSRHGSFKFWCDICKRGFLRKEAYVVHRRKHDRRKQVIVNSQSRCENFKWWCDICKQGFPHVFSYDVHMKTHQPEVPEKDVVETGQQQKPRWWCNICQKGFAQETTYDGHMRKHEGRPYVCEYCAKEVSSYRALQDHLSCHTGKYLLYCPTCNKGFNHKTKLENHLPSHSGSFRCWCEICEKGFTNKYSYNCHMRKHKGTSLVCDYCEKKFVSNQGLKFHLSKHTGKYAFRCGKCHRGFNDKTKLERHKKYCANVYL